MIITDIESINKRKCRIYIDGEKAFNLYSGEVSKLGIAKDCEISSELYDKIMYEILLKRVRLRALHILEKHPRTKKQLADKLNHDEYPAELVENALNYVESYHYVDDMNYAISYLQSGYKKKSKNQLMLDLYRRGIDRDTANAAFDSFVSETDDYAQSEIEIIKKIICKKLPDIDKATIKDKQRIYRYLISKGFSSSDINRQLNAIEFVGE